MERELEMTWESLARLKRLNTILLDAIKRTQRTEARTALLLSISASSLSPASLSNLMARYLARSCPRCNAYVGITIREPRRNVPVEAVNGHCTRSTYRMTWIVIRVKEAARDKIRNASRT